MSLLDAGGARWIERRGREGVAFCFGADCAGLVDLEVGGVEEDEDTGPAIEA